MSDINLQTATADELRAYIARMQQQPGPRLTLKISDKSGALSVYGLGHFPVTLYAAQWERLLAFAPAITEYIKLNRAKLAVKPAKEATKT
jgi:hypothetical protein